MTENQIGFVWIMGIIIGVFVLGAIQAKYGIFNDEASWGAAALPSAILFWPIVIPVCAVLFVLVMLFLFSARLFKAFFKVQHRNHPERSDQVD